MAIHPIDLQTMYAQIANVAKQAAFQQQGAQLSESMQQHEIVKENMEESSKVQRTSGDQAKAASVDKDGKNNDGNDRHDKHNGREQPEKKSEQERIKESYLGQHIDITR